MVIILVRLIMMIMFSPGRGRYNEQRHHIVLCRKLAQPRPQGVTRICSFSWVSPMSIIGWLNKETIFKLDDWFQIFYTSFCCLLQLLLPSIMVSNETVLWGKTLNFLSVCSLKAQFHCNWKQLKDFAATATQFNATHTTWFNWCAFKIVHLVCILHAHGNW